MGALPQPPTPRVGSSTGCASRFRSRQKTKLVTGGVFAVSPDGRQLAFLAAGSDGIQRIWIRSLHTLETRPLPGSESPVVAPFFWSPDSRYIAYGDGQKLKKIDISAGTAETLCEAPGVVIGGSWIRDGVIIFGQGPGSIMRVSANGGAASAVTVLDASRGEVAQLLPSFLPDGRHFIYLQIFNETRKQRALRWLSRRQTRGTKFRAACGNWPRSSLRAIFRCRFGAVTVHTRRGVDGAAIRRSSAAAGRRANDCCEPCRVVSGVWLFRGLEQWRSRLPDRRRGKRFSAHLVRPARKGRGHCRGAKLGVSLCVRFPGRNETCCQPVRSGHSSLAGRFFARHEYAVHIRLFLIRAGGHVVARWQPDRFRSKR